jgi:hypothetical protein
MVTAEHKAMKRSYLEGIAIITIAINEWDPYGLIGGGAPADEFEREIARIAARIHEVKTPEALAEVISKVFSESFEPKPFSVQSCHPVASRLFVQLQTHSLLLERKP